MTKLGQSAKKKSVFTRVVMPLVLVGAALIAAAYLFLRDLEPPSVAIGPETTIITPGTEFSVVAADTKSGLMTLYIEISQNGNVREHFDNTFTERTITYTKTLLLNKELYQDGPIEIRAKARDSSLNPFGKYTIVTATYTLDSVRPTIAADSRQLNINQGGSGFISYTVNEAVQKTGVRVGTNFFPGYLQTGSTYFCLFAMPHDTPPGEFKPEILAIDLAGNENIRPLRYHANARSFKADRINLPESFLISKGELFEQTFPGDPETDPLGRYLKINTELRAKNRARLKEIGLNTSPTPLFDGAFLRAPGSTTAGFADNRDYYYQGVPVDNQTHLGFDIASVQNAPVQAAGPGIVVLAEFFGIYGNCVIVDHGLGLQTLYSHLDEILVATGQTVAHEGLLGKTGMTGLAGGDHLHFGVLLSGVAVQPREWWDPTWMENNITSKLQ